MSEKPVSPYKNVDALLQAEPELQQRPELRGRMAKLDTLQKSILRYRQLPKRNDAQRAHAKAVFFGILDDFGKAMPQTLRPYLGTDDIHMQAQTNQRAQQSLLDVPAEGAPAAKEQAAEGFERISDTVYKARDLIQPRRPTIMKAEHVLNQIHVGLYEPFLRALAKSARADRATPTGRHNLEQLTNLERVMREVEGVDAMLDFVRNIAKFDARLKKQASEEPRPKTGEIGVDPKYFWQQNREALQPRLTEICEAFEARIRAIDKLTIIGQPAGYKLTPAYEACVAAVNTMRDLKFYRNLQSPHDAVKHYAFEFVLGGKNAETAERDHKLIHRIEDAYHADLTALEHKGKRHGRERIVAMDRSPRVAQDSTPLDSPLEKVLFVLDRVYEARWAMIADDIVTLARGSKTLGNADVPARLESDAEPLPSGSELQPAPHAMEKRQFAAMQRRAASEHKNRRGELPVFFIDGDQPM